MTSARWADRPQGRALPPGWNKIRRRILARDPDCTLALPGCLAASAEVDHIDDPDDHSDANLRGVCHPCHARRTALQAAAGRAASLARRPRTRPKQRHPGLL